MRPIKFRAWDEPNETGGPEGMSYNARPDCDATAIMQFTGILDKDGKEIYDGDILHTRSELVNLSSGRQTGKFSEKLSVVEWNTDGWGYFHARSIENSPCTIGFKVKGIKILAKYSSVVGNIYENPYLVTLEEAV